MKRSAVSVLLVLTAALLAAGCGGGSGSSSSSTAPEAAPKKATAPNAPAGSKVVSCGGGGQLRATAVGCATAHKTMSQWGSRHACSLGNASRGSCSVGVFRCQAVKVGQGVSVSCAGPDGDVSFVKPAG
jgi:hypothetical protein